MFITQNQIAFLKAKEEAALNREKTREQQMKNQMRNLANLEELSFRYGDRTAETELAKQTGSSSGNVWRYLEGSSDALKQIVSPFQTLLTGKASDNVHSRKELI